MGKISSIAIKGKKKGKKSYKVNYNTLLQAFREQVLNDKTFSK